MNRVDLKWRIDSILVQVVNDLLRIDGQVVTKFMERRLVHMTNQPFGYSVVIPSVDPSEVD